MNKSKSMPIKDSNQTQDNNKAVKADSPKGRQNNGKKSKDNQTENG